MQIPCQQHWSHPHDKDNHISSTSLMLTTCGIFFSVCCVKCWCIIRVNCCWLGAHNCSVALWWMLGQMPGGSRWMEGLCQQKTNHNTSLKKYKCLLPWIINQPPGENMLVLLASIPLAKTPFTRSVILWLCRGWVGLWGFLWWAPSAKRKDHHGVSSGWSSAWHRSNTGLSSTQYEQIPIILGVWTFWLTPFFFRSITFWRAYG